MPAPSLDEFEPWPSIPRLNRDIIITEKIDGSNAQISIRPGAGVRIAEQDTVAHVNGEAFLVRAGSRKQWLTPTKSGDNFGFAAWVHDHAQVLAETLGEGRHYGEWWGQGIQRRYGRESKTFSLFNSHRWTPELLEPAQRQGVAIDVVPTLYTGPFSSHAVNAAVTQLAVLGSLAAPGFMNAEGVIVYHLAAHLSFKVTCKDDEKPKGQIAAEQAAA